MALYVMSAVLFIFSICQSSSFMIWLGCRAIRGARQSVSERCVFKACIFLSALANLLAVTFTKNFSLTHSLPAHSLGVLRGCTERLRLLSTFCLYRFRLTWALSTILSWNAGRSNNQTRIVVLKKENDPTAFFAIECDDNRLHSFGLGRNWVVLHFSSSKIGVEYYSARTLAKGLAIVRLAFSWNSILVFTVRLSKWLSDKLSSA